MSHDGQHLHRLKDHQIPQYLVVKRHDQVADLCPYRMLAPFESNRIVFMPFPCLSLQNIIWLAGHHGIINPNTRRVRHGNQRSGETMAGVSQVQFTKKIRLSHTRRFSPDSARILGEEASRQSPQTRFLNS